MHALPGAGSRGSDLPPCLPTFLQAAGALAVAAAEQGDVAEARRILEQALQALERAGRPVVVPFRQAATC